MPNFTIGLLIEMDSAAEDFDLFLQQIVISLCFFVRIQRNLQSYTNHSEISFKVFGWSFVLPLI